MLPRIPLVMRGDQHEQPFARIGLLRQCAARMSHRGRAGSALLFALICVFAALPAGCLDVPRNSTEKNNLAALSKVNITITDRTTFVAYVARESRQITLGLMNVTKAELPDDHGMIFVFDDDRLRSFWMRNTIIPLDIAYIRSDGTIVKIHTMEPLNESGYPSMEPARFALEVNAGQFARWGIQEGDRVELPADLFN